VIITPKIIDNCRALRSSTDSLISFNRSIRTNFRLDDPMNGRIVGPIYLGVCASVIDAPTLKTKCKKHRAWSFAPLPLGSSISDPVVSGESVKV
jgi:hypothetical protein